MTPDPADAGPPQGMGVTPSGSGHSSKTEPSCMVSAQSVSVPNASDFTEGQRKWLLATPRQEPAEAGWICRRAGITSANAFAGFARHNASLFQRIRKPGPVIQWTYRLSPLGADFANALQSERTGS